MTTANSGIGHGVVYVLRFLALRPALLVLPLFVWWGATHLDGFSWDYDEGIHVYIAWLVQQGHPLYAQTFSPYTPGAIVPLVVAFNLFGASVAVARMTALIASALGLLGVMMVAGELARADGREWTKPLAELAAGALLVSAPSFVQWSRAAMSDAPSAGLMALAVALALIYLRRGGLRWLFAAEAIAVCALWVKLISIGGGAAVALALGLGLYRRRRDLPRAVIGSLVVVLCAALPLLFFDARALYEQAIYFHVQKRAAYESSPAGNFALLIEFLSRNLALVALVIPGLCLSLVNRATRPISVVALVWFAFTFASLMAQTPLFANHHPVVLVFALSALAGAGVALAIDRLSLAVHARRQDVLRAGHLLPLAGVSACIVIALLAVPQYGEQWRDVLAPPFQPIAEEAVSLLSALTPASDLLVSDAQMIAFRARRQSPPELADTSQARLSSGNLTAAQIVAAAQKSNANGVLFWSGRIESSAPFVEWVGQNYRPVRSSFQKPNSSYRFFLREPHPQFPLEAHIGQGIRLLGYDLNRRAGSSITAGQPLSLTLYFQRIGTVDRSYTVFVHLLASDGRLVAQDDRPPLGGRYPTDRLRADEWIADEFAMPLDADLPAGAYRIEIGMYVRETLERLPVMVAEVRQAEDRLLLPPVVIKGQ